MENKMEHSRYTNGKIYKLVNNTDKDIYVGSTCELLSKRLYGHKMCAKSKTQTKVYKHLNEIGWDNVEIILIESFPCANKMELVKRERYWVDQLSPSLNTFRPSVTPEEEKEQEKLYRSQDYTCDLCQTTCKVSVKQRHIQTKKHMQLVAEQKQKEQLIKKELHPWRYREYECDLCQTTCKITVKQRHIETKKHQKLQKEREKQKESQEKEVEIKE